MEEIKKQGEPLEDDMLDNVAGGRWDEKIEFICKNCKKSTMALTKPPVCPKCGKSM